MVEPVKLGPFLGINNKLPTEKLSTKEGTFVRDAVNVDLTLAGTFQRRPGHTLVSAGTRARSLWGDGDVGYYADGASLKLFTGTSTSTITTLGDANADVTFDRTPLGVVWSDGVKIERITNNTSAPLAPPTPNPVPAVSATTGGSLEAGTYTVAFATVTSAGLRSPISAFQTVTVGVNGSISIAMVSSSYATQVFITPVGGASMYREAVLTAGTTSASINVISSQGLPVTSTVEAALPAGKFVRGYRGRLLVASGSYVFYSLPYNEGVYHPLTGFIALDGAVTLCEPTQTGVFLATAEKTWFLDGLDVATAELKPLAPYGAVPNTVVQEPHALNMWWMTPRGLVRTTDQNTLELRQDEHMAFGKSTSGAGLYREENGITQVISVLSGTASTGAASASSYMDAQVIN